MSDIENDPRLDRAAGLMNDGQTLQAELLFQAVLSNSPGNRRAIRGLAQLAMLRADAPRAAQLLHELVQAHPNDAESAIDLAVALAETGRIAEAIHVVQGVVDRQPTHHEGWLFLGHLKDARGDRAEAVRAWYRAVIGAQRVGKWKDEQSTSPHLLASVVQAIEQVRLNRKALLLGSYEEIRARHGAGALGRVDVALENYLRERKVLPSHDQQRPKFFYFPGLPDTGYHDPYLHPWASQLQSSFSTIRADALRVLEEDQRFESFLSLSEKANLDDYIRSDISEPAWDAFFFYRHGQRLDANHARCPGTSSVLESIELCRIADQAPEICFSVLKAGTHIMPHHGVTNVRLVMHLPLLVPPSCALNLVGVGEHHWEEGRLALFDDTFLHEAWNRSRSTRMILLMDCWNPHLTEVERLAIKELIEMISSFQLADRAPAVKQN